MLQVLIKYRKVLYFITAVSMAVIMGVLFYQSLLDGHEYHIVNRFALIICIGCVLIVGISSYLILFTKCKVEVIFIITFFATGLIYNFIITPYAVPDEHYHWQQTTRLTNFVFETPENRDKFMWDDYYIEGTTRHFNNKDAYETLMTKLFMPVTPSNDTKYMDFGYAYRGSGCIYPVQYFPTITGRVIGQIFSFNNIMQFYISRLFNLLFSSVILYFAIKIIPKFKISIFVISMLPMFLQQSASYSYDAFINSMSFLLIALLLREIYYEPAYALEKASPESIYIKPGRYVLITLIATITAPVKYVYSLLILLVLLIPKNRFKNKIDYLIKSTMSIVLTFSSAAFHYLLHAAEPSVSELNWEGHTSFSNSFILNNPIQTMRIFVETTKTNLGAYIRGAFGEHLCALSLPINTALITAFIILFVLTLFSNKTDIVAVGNKTSKNIRILLAFVSIAIYLGILYSMFVGWTSDIHSTIQGVQGRYFIPLLLPIAIVFNNRLLVHKGGLDKFIMSASVILNVFVIFDVLQKTIMG